MKTRTLILAGFAILAPTLALAAVPSLGTVSFALCLFSDFLGVACFGRAFK
jgi:hypothetical protein